MANFSVKDMLKAIRDNSSAIYKDIVPDYDETNLAQVGDSILKEENVAMMCAYMLLHFLKSEGDPLGFVEMQEKR